MRQLKFHEQKLLKKVDFLQWKNEHNQRELQVSSGGGMALLLSLRAANKSASMHALLLNCSCGCTTDHQAVPHPEQGRLQEVQQDLRHRHQAGQRHQAPGRARPRAHRAHGPSPGQVGALTLPTTSLPAIAGRCWGPVHMHACTCKCHSQSALHVLIGCRPPAACETGQAWRI